MDQQRIPVYAEPEMKRPNEVAAAKYNVAVTESCLSAIVQPLTDDDSLEEVQGAIPVKRTQDQDRSADLRALQ